MVLKDEGWSRCAESSYGCNGCSGCSSLLASSPTEGFYPTGKVSSLHSLDHTNWEDVGSIDDEGAVESMKAEDVLSKRPLYEPSLSEGNAKECRRDVRWKTVMSRRRRLKLRPRISKDGRRKEAQQ